MRIVVADPSRTARKLVSRLLKSDGHSVSAVDDVAGRELRRVAVD